MLFASHHLRFAEMQEEVSKPQQHKGSGSTSKVGATDSRAFSATLDKLEKNAAKENYAF